jgi:hypothetical protein
MRKASWPEDLNRYLSHAPDFTWGQMDCCHWCAGWVETTLGIDLAADFRGQYDTKEGAYAYLKEKGFADVDALADAFLPRIEINLAQRGDIVCFQIARIKALGICGGGRSFFLQTGGIIESVRTRACIAAWRVG